MKRFSIISNDKRKCGYCGKEYSKNGIETHIWRSHEAGINFNPNDKRQDLQENGKFKIWNKDLTKEKDIRVKKSAETQLKNFKSGKIIPSMLGKKLSLKIRKKISIRQSLNNKGGRCKWFKAIRNDGIAFNVQGTWELKFAAVLNTLDPNWIKIGVGNKNHSFKWRDINELEHWYTPDFYSPKLKKYFEIKGYWWGNDKEKMQLVLEQNNINIEILKKKELNSYLKIINEKI